MKFLKNTFSKAAKKTSAGLLILSVSGGAFANGNVANGQRLFTSSNCNQCHGTDVYTRADRKVKSLAALEAQVRRCDSNLNTNWFDDEIIDVTAYLNNQFYKF